MTCSIVVLGSGKMARNIGLWFVRCGYRVLLASSSAEYRDNCAEYMQKSFNRMKKNTHSPLIAPHIGSYNEIFNEKVDVIIEATNEILEKKQQSFKAIEQHISSGTLLLTSSSSILPGQIRSGCMGIHFFYPVELTGVVELIAESATPKERLEQLKSFAASCNLSFIVENEKNAFIANRLLLPIQAEAMRMVNQGLPAPDIDACTKNDLLGFGQMGLIDAIGLEIVFQSVSNYLSMIPVSEQNDYSVLAETLKTLVNSGMLGRKNNNGLLCGTQPGKSNKTLNANDRSSLSKTFFSLFINTCCAFMERGLIDSSSLNVILSKAFHADRTLPDIIEREGARAIADHCNTRLLETGISYFKPSGILGR